MISSRVGPSPGIQPSAEWIVDASIPVDSAIRRAARPVGATSAIEAVCAFAAAQISRIVAVLPVAGTAGDDREPLSPNAGLDRGPLLGRGDQVVGRGGGASSAGSSRASRRIVAASSASSARDGGR